MTKSSKLIATLGVVAGLGVAALPLGVFADQTSQNVTGTVQVDVEVQPAISMTITGNNDANGKGIGSTTYTNGAYAAVDNSSHPEGQDLTAEPKVYGTDPLNDDADIQFANPSSSYLSITPNNMLWGTMTKAGTVDDSAFGSKITVFTNSQGGYTLSVRDADSTTDLKNTTTGSNAAIPTTATTLVAGTAGWGYKVTSTDDQMASNGETPVATVLGQQYAITATDFKLTKSVTTEDGTASTTVVNYGVATDEAQETGIYADTIIYTATTN